MNVTTYQEQFIFGTLHSSSNYICYRLIEITNSNTNVFENTKVLLNSCKLFQTQYVNVDNTWTQYYSLDLSKQLIHMDVETNKIYTVTEELISNSPISIEKSPLCIFYLLTDIENNKRFLLFTIHHSIYDSFMTKLILDFVFDQKKIEFIIPSQEYYSHSETIKDWWRAYLNKESIVSSFFCIPTSSTHDKSYETIKYSSFGKYWESIKLFCSQYNISRYSFLLFIWGFLLDLYTLNSSTPCIIGLYNNRSDKYSNSMIPLMTSLCHLVQLDRNASLVQNIQTIYLNYKSVLDHSSIDYHNIHNIISSKEKSFTCLNLVYEQYEYPQTNSYRIHRNINYRQHQYDLMIDVNISKEDNEYESRYNWSSESFGNCVLLSFSTTKYTKEFIDILYERFEYILNQTLERPLELLENISFQIDHADTVSGELSYTYPIAFNPLSDSYIVYKDKKTTYQELYKKSMEWINSHSNLCGKIVIISMLRSDQFLIILLALYLSGAIYCPVHPSEPVERLNHLIEKTQPSLVVFENREIVYYNNNTYNNDEMYILSTSGTTGTPKQVVISRTSFLNNIRSVLSTTQLFHKNTILQTSKCTFDVHVIETLGSLLTECNIVIPDEQYLLKSSYISTLINTYQVEIFPCVPSYLNILFSSRLHNESYSVVSEFWFVGEPVPFNLIKDLCSHKSSYKFYNCYGPAETTIYSTIHSITGKETNCIPIGKSLPGYTVFVMNKYFQPCPAYMKGEIYIGGHALMNEYLNDPRKTNEVITVHPSFGRLYKTGDIGMWTSDYNLLYLGRVDHQVKINGQRLEPSEIEQVLLKNTTLKQVIVYKHPNDSDCLSCYYICKETEEINKSKLVQVCSKYLPPFMIPQKWLQLISFPLSSNSKIDRKQLPYINIETKEESICDNLEDAVLQSYQQVLQNKNFRFEDDFFLFGGSSILANLISRKLKRWNVSMIDVLKYHSPSSLCSFISTRSNLSSSIISNSISKVDLPKMTHLLYTGSGVYSSGLGLKRYQQSSKIKNCWDAVETYFLKYYGFSFININTHNPKKLEIDLSPDMIVKYESIIHPDLGPIFETELKTKKIIFENSEGLMQNLYFQQPLILLSSISELYYLKDTNQISPVKYSAGFSFGELISLFTCYNSLEPLIDWIELIFKRMILCTYQSSQSNKVYKTYYINLDLVNPKKQLTNSLMAYMFSLISSKTNKLIEIVSYYLDNSYLLFCGEKESVSILLSTLDELYQLDSSSIPITKELIKEFVSTITSYTDIDIENRNYITELSFHLPSHTYVYQNLVSWTRDSYSVLLEKHPLDYSDVCNRHITSLTGIPISLDDTFLHSLKEFIPNEMFVKLEQYKTTMNDQSYFIHLLIELMSVLIIHPSKWSSVLEYMLLDKTTSSISEISSVKTFKNLLLMLKMSKKQSCLSYHHFEVN